MYRSPLALLRRLRSDERGTAIVELSLVAPVLALLTVGIVDLSQGVTRRMELSEAIHRTLEKASAKPFKFSPTEDPDYSGLEEDTVEAAGGTAKDIDLDDVTLRDWLECDGVEITDDSVKVCPAGQTTARYIQISILSYYEPIFGQVVSPDTNGRVPLFAEAAVRIQ